MRSSVVTAVVLALVAPACAGRSVVAHLSGGAGAGDGGNLAPPDGGPVTPGAGCGRPLPLDQPTTQPGSAIGYKHYRVMGTGANLTEVNDATKVGPRTFWVRVPADYDPYRRYRVVYLLQGCGAFEAANNDTYPLYEGDEEAIYVAVDVPEDSASSCYDDRAGLSSQEWEAFQLFEDVVESNYCVDSDRIYVAGGLGGAQVANMWGCYFAATPTPPRKFAPKYHVRAQLTVFGSEPAVQPPCGGPVAALLIRDTGDLADPSSASPLARLERVNGCDPASADAATQVPWHAEVPAIGSVCEKLPGCPADSPIVICTTTGQFEMDQASRFVPAAKLFLDELEADDAAEGGADVGVVTTTNANACRVELPTKCGGACVNLETDDANCGACGHACTVASTCGAGRCTTPTQVVQHVDVDAGSCPTISLALADSTLYWAEKETGRIMSVPTSGGVPQVFATSEEQADSIAVRGGRVFWRIAPDLGAIPRSTVTPAIRTRSTQGGSITTVYAADPGNWIFSFVATADGQTVYFAGDSSNHVAKVPVTGGASTEITLDAEFPATMDLEGTTLIIGAGPGDSAADVDVLDLAGGGPVSCSARDPITNALTPMRCTPIARGQGAIKGPLAVKDGNVYWADLEHVGVNALAPAGSGYVPYSIVTTVGGSMTAMALGADAVFFSVVADPVAGGDWIGKAALAPGSPPVRVARTSGPGSSLVTDGTHLYWSTSSCDIVSATP